MGEGNIYFEFFYVETVKLSLIYSKGLWEDIQVKKKVTQMLNQAKIRRIVGSPWQRQCRALQQEQQGKLL